MPASASLPPGVEPRLAYSVLETARLLDVGESTVWRLLRDGKLQRINIRGATRVPFASIQQLLEGGEQ